MNIIFGILTILAIIGLSYIISEDKLKELLKKSSIFNVMEANDIVYSDILKDTLDEFGYNTIEEFVDKSVKSKAKSFLKTKDIGVLKQLEKNEYVSFLYAIYYGVYGNNKYKWNSGFVISQILEGQLRVEDSIKMFVYITKWCDIYRQL